MRRCSLPNETEVSESRGLDETRIRTYAAVSTWESAPFRKWPVEGRNTERIFDHDQCHDSVTREFVPNW
jgi:hypothetical protein